MCFFSSLFCFIYILQFIYIYIYIFSLATDEAIDNWTQRDMATDEIPSTEDANLAYGGNAAKKLRGLISDISSVGKVSKKCVCCALSCAILTFFSLLLDS